MASRMHTIGPQAGYQHTHTIIFLHGRDSTNEEFANELFESESSPGRCNGGQGRTLPALLPSVRWVFPAAPLLRSERFDTVMSQWFDMWSADRPQERVEIQIDGLKRSVDLLLEVIQAEEAILPRQNIFLAGISQGFALALASFFADGQGFAGLLGLCSWMPFSNVLGDVGVSIGEDIELRTVQGVFASRLSMDRANSPGALKSTPIFLGHASDDEVVPVENGKRMHYVLRHRLQLDVEFHEYPEGGHWVNEPQGLDDMVDFFRCHMALDVAGRQ